MSEIADCLMKAGFKRTTALVVSVLADGEKHTMRDIERKADLRQPEVSMAFKEIKHYLKIETKNTEGKGRPFKCVQMKQNAFRIMLNDYKEAIATEHEDKIQAIDAAMKEVGA